MKKEEEKNEHSSTQLFSRSSYFLEFIVDSRSERKILKQRRTSIKSIHHQKKVEVLTSCARA